MISTDTAPAITNKTSNPSIHTLGAGNNINSYRHNGDENKHLPETYAALVSSLASFLRVTVHQILFLRSIYPQSTFLPVRQFNHPVKQSRHSKVCNWVNDACAAVEAQLLKSSVSTVSVVILSVSTNRPLERYTFDLTKMPQVSPGDVNTPFESSIRHADGGDKQQQQAGGDTNGSKCTDLEAQFRAVLARLASACARLTPLSPDEEYLPTIHIELSPDADAPAGMSKADQLWIAAEPENLKVVDDKPRGQIASLSCEDFGHHNSHDDNGNNDEQTRSKRISQARAKTVPVRTVDAGEMKLEVWVEESNSKFEELDRNYRVH